MPHVLAQLSGRRTRDALCLSIQRGVKVKEGLHLEVEESLWLPGAPSALGACGGFYPAADHVV